MFKIAYGAGHNLHTAGRCIPRSLDPQKTKEWVLNDRVARYFAQAAAQYPDVVLLRVDDPAGQASVSLSGRCKKANDWGADFCLAIHHNGGINLGTGGGIVAYSCPGSRQGVLYRDAIYDACIAAGGLRGNRANPKTTANFQVLRQTNAPAVLMEYGFMDSKTDASVILSDDYAKLVAYTTMDGIAQCVGLKKEQTKISKQEECTVNVKTLSNGNQGAAVKALQLLLIGFGYSCGSSGADGVFGAKTLAAVKNYQKGKGLVVDGIVGTETWTSLLGA